MIDFHIRYPAFEVAEGALPCRHAMDAIHADRLFTFLLAGDHPSIVKVREAVAANANSPYPVWIGGPSGSGKELAAIALHRWSWRSKRRIVTAYLGGTDTGHTESLLFGHVKGAWSGAVSSRIGLLAEANDSTLVLNEVHAAQRSTQDLLMEAASTGCFRQMGANKVLKTTARFVSLSNADMEMEVEAGRFRHQRAIFIDERVPVPGQIGGRLTRPRRGIQVGR